MSPPLPAPPRSRETDEHLRRRDSAALEPERRERPAGRVSRAFYGPPDWLAYRVTARTRRAIGFWLLALWLGPGTALWLVLRDALWFIGFMSIFALWWTGLGSFGAETPVEREP